ncbi:MAG TPA: class I SAM-dependent methyltransferase [Gemmataceae bacterium]|nr:class I SAM-dependent methyltransferase [Gemmataceae bacterium]
MFHPQGPTFYELAVQALSSTRRGYDLLAPKFDHTPFRTPDWLLNLVGDYLQTLTPFDSGLDLCCGTGAGVALLRPLCRSRVVGLDFSQGMLEVCRKHVPDMPGSAAVELVRADALAMPFGAAFDVVVCFGAFGHILERDEPRFVAEVARVLRPGGRFVFVTASMPPVTSPGYWIARAFNAAMHLRNFLIRPPFIMYYLTFLLPRARRLLERAGLVVEERPLALERPLRNLRLVVATRPA